MRLSYRKKHVLKDMSSWCEVHSLWAPKQVSPTVTDIMMVYDDDCYSCFPFALTVFIQ